LICRRDRAHEKHRYFHELGRAPSEIQKGNDLIHNVGRGGRTAAPSRARRGWRSGSRNAGAEKRHHHLLTARIRLEEPFGELAVRDVPFGDQHHFNP
jgi:hypothetical protein